MSERTLDYSAGLAPAREQALRGAIPDLYRFSENFLCAVYDPALDLGLWLHWGTNPDDFSLTEEQVLVALPGDGGMVWSRGYWRPDPAERPSGHTLKYDVVEPFRRLRVRFDAVAVRTPYPEMLAGLARDGMKEFLSFDLEVTTQGPAWDNHVSAQGGTHRGSMQDQDWANDHYQQAIRAVGTVHVDGQGMAFDGIGSRDHSRGQRGHRPNTMAGHNLLVAAFPDGRSFGVQRMWKTDGTFSLNVGYVCVDGVMHQCDVLSRPVFVDALQVGGDPIELVLRSALGEHVITGRIARSLFTTRSPRWSVRLGADPAPDIGLFVPGFAVYEWGGMTAGGLVERSGLPGLRYDIGQPWAGE